LLVNLRSRSCRGTAKSCDVSRRVHPRARFVHHSAVINRRANFARQIRFLHDSKLVSKFSLNRLRAAPESVKVLRFACDFQMTATRKIAVDIFFAHDRLNGIDRFERGRVNPLRGFSSISGDQRRRAELQSGEHHAAVAAARPPSNILSFEHCHFRTTLRQSARRGQSGESRTDYGNVHGFRQFTHEYLRRFDCLQPIIFLFGAHRICAPDAPPIPGSSCTARYASSMAASVYARAAESEFAMVMFPWGARPITFGRGPGGRSRSEYQSYSYAYP